VLTSEGALAFSEYESAHPTVAPARGGALDGFAGCIGVSTSPFVFAARVVIAISIAVASGAGVVTAADAQAAAPKAPSNAHMLGGVLTWQDNSTDEDGFRITAHLSGSTSGSPDVDRSYDVPANTTSFPLPGEASPNCDRPFVDWFVVATKGAASSAPAVASMVIECFVDAPPASLPQAGIGASEEASRGSEAFAGYALIAGVWLLGLGLAWNWRHIGEPPP
jgi:hypothetical protein